MNNEIRRLLTEVSNGDISVDEALLKIKMKPYEDIGIAKLDTHRKMRQGVAEVIYGASKSAMQIVDIVLAMEAANQTPILITRMDRQKANIVKERIELTYYDTARVGIVGEMPRPDGIGKILIVTAGTSDIPVAEEALLTAKALGNEADAIYDVGVAGLHRLLAHIDEIMSASVIIAIAGMEGALASVIGGLSDCPVIAVPTSVGYGASYEGLTALLSMMNSCASGVSVVNIDNGFGAGYMASMINHMGK